MVLLWSAVLVHQENGSTSTADERQGRKSESQLWRTVHDCFVARLLPDALGDDVLAAAPRDSEAAGLPSITVSPVQDKLLQLLAQVQGARHILETGTLGGYGTIWLGRALPADGRLASLEYDPKHAEVAIRNLARAGLGQQVEVRAGPGVGQAAPAGPGQARVPRRTGLARCTIDSVNMRALKRGP